MMVFYVFGHYCHGWDILFREEESGLFLNSRSLVEELKVWASFFTKDDAGIWWISGLFTLPSCILLYFL